MLKIDCVELELTKVEQSVMMPENAMIIKTYVLKKKLIIAYYYHKLNGTQNMKERTFVLFSTGDEIVYPKEFGLVFIDSLFFMIEKFGDNYDYFHLVEKVRVMLPSGIKIIR